jgi:nucleoside-diphosphate-sugar epimerase
VRAAARGCEVVVDNAALVPISRVSAGSYREVNLGGCANVLDAAQAEGAYVVHVSSTSIYGVPRRLPVTRDTPLRPFEPYGRSKAEAERLVETRRSGGFPIASLRTRALLGPGRLGVFDLIFARVRAGRPVPVLGADNQVQMCHVADFCAAALAAIERRSNGTYNICAAEIGPSLRADLEELIARVGSGARVVGIPQAAARLLLPPLAALRLVPLTPWHWRGAPAAFVADLSDAREELGWWPQRSNVDALLDAYEHFLDSSPRADAAPHRRPLAGPLARLLRR